MTRQEKIGLAAGVVGAFALGALIGVVASRKGELPKQNGNGFRGLDGGLGVAPAVSPAALPAVSPPTRPSCIQCVEKHLGSACCLMGECRDGYPHRLYAIGNLHEAEEESQSWPALHDAIRQARRRYQEQGAPPDFEQLARLVEQVRRA